MTARPLGFRRPSAGPLRHAAACGTLLWCRRPSGASDAPPYAAALAAWFDPARLLMVTVRRDEDLFWAMEEGLRCPGMAAVLGETRAADPTAGRRLSLAAEKSGVPALLLRSQPAPTQSVCTTRWRVASAPSHSTPGLNDVGAPRWRIELRRNRFGAPSVTETPSWLLEWNDETHCLSVVSQALHGSARESDARRRETGRLGPPPPSSGSTAARAWSRSTRMPAPPACAPHMRLADARALVPDLITTAGEPQADRRLIETIANWCDRYTPWVAIDPLGGAIAEEGTEACSAGGFGGDAGLLLDVTGCAHLFGQGRGGRTRAAGRPGRASGPPRPHLPRRHGRHRGCGLGAGALRRTPGRSLLPAARPARRRSPQLPVEGLRLDAPILETFLKLGLRRIGDLYPLPRAPLARRFGDQPLTRLDQALGTLAEPIEPRRTPPAFRTRLAFVEPIGRPEDIAAATSRLLAALCRQFEQAGVGARKLEIALYRVDGSVDRTSIGTSRPNRDNPKLMKLFEEKLGELDPGFGVELMILAAPEVEAFERHAGRAARRRARSPPRWARTARSISPTGWRCGWARRTSCACCRATAICPSACRRPALRPSPRRPAPGGAWRG